jgi:hypothetical protein
MAEFRLDWARGARTGLSEAVLCEPKSSQGLVLRFRNCSLVR